jgi:phosphohistidine phosphatase
LAVPAEQDPERPLSAEGRPTATRVAAYLAKLGPQLVDPPLSQIWHSGKLRAQQTAEIFAQALAPGVAPAVHGGMKPKDNPTSVYEELMVFRERPIAILLSGHLPHLAGLAGLLLAGDADKAPIRFTNAAVLRLCFYDGSWAVAWYLTPACVP